MKTFSQVVLSRIVDINLQSFLAVVMIQYKKLQRLALFLQRLTQVQILSPVRLHFSPPRHWL